jgi:tetraprenyl-beta-curcumene synthase
MPGSRRDRTGRLSLFGAFALAALRYWLTVFPRVALELRHWRRSAERIADPAARQLALDSLAKRSNMEGAAAFAAFVPLRRRTGVIRALVAFQAIYNYADVLAEQPSDDPVGNARRLHQTLLHALDPGGECPARGVDDSVPIAADYLKEMTDACETATWGLPSFGTVSTAACRAAERIVAFQSLSLDRPGELEAWAALQGPETAGLAWWEVAAAAGSSLAVLALIAAAAAPRLQAQDVAGIEAAYFPSIGALHSLLDSLVDEAEDAETGQLRLLDCYPSRRHAVEGVERLTKDALTAVRELSGPGHQHELLLTAMACSYLSAPEASATGADAVRRAARASLGPSASAMLRVFALRRLAGSSRSTRDGVAAAEPATPAVTVDAKARGADARAA